MHKKRTLNLKRGAFTGLPAVWTKLEEFEIDCGRFQPEEEDYGQTHAGLSGVSACLESMLLGVCVKPRLA
jgi:hypothetical protein